MTAMVAAHIALASIDEARWAGVRRGINASIADIEKMAKTASDAEVITLIKVIRQLNTLTVKLAEDN
jgi:uncharacterized protein HemX